jgi:SAM-dependent methyltransferase
MMDYYLDYYADNLSGLRLKKCYDVAPVRFQQYLGAEIDFAKSRMKSGDAVLDLGCGYGRIAFALSAKAGRVVGIDTAAGSIELASELARGVSNCEFSVMDAGNLSFPESSFDVVFCLQNGICAFGVSRRKIVDEALRVTRGGGRAIFTSYTSEFWPHRLEWFEAMHKHGLIGEIDYQESKDGVIYCKDGHQSGIMTESEFRASCEIDGSGLTVTEFDRSCLAFELTKKTTA